MGNVNTTGSELIHFPLFFQLFFLLHTPPINLEIEEAASWIKVLLNQEQVHNPNRQLALPGSILESLLNLKTQQDNSRRLQISRSRAAEWQSKRCNRLRPQVKKGPQILTNRVIYNLHTITLPYCIVKKKKSKNTILQHLPCFYFLPLI